MTSSIEYSVAEAICCPLGCQAEAGGHECASKRELAKARAAIEAVRGAVQRTRNGSGDDHTTLNRLIDEALAGERFIIPQYRVQVITHLFHPDAVWSDWRDLTVPITEPTILSFEFRGPVTDVQRQEFYKQFERSHAISEET